MDNTMDFTGTWITRDGSKVYVTNDPLSGEFLATNDSGEDYKIDYNGNAFFNEGDLMLRVSETFIKYYS